MAKFPIDSPQDYSGIVDAINYALSGPAGLGQNFSGFSSSEPVYIRPSTRQPWSLPLDTTLDPSLYLDVPITTIATVGSNPAIELTITFATPFTDAPFQMGDKFTLTNTVASGGDPDFYNGYTYTVMECSTTDCRVSYVKSGQPSAKNWPALSAPGGNIIRDYYDYPNSTDCNGRISVQGATDRVFINAQMVLDAEYTASMPSEFEIDFTIARLVGFPNTAPGSTDYYFLSDTIVATRTFHFSVSADGTVEDLEAIFTSVIEENIPFGYYWYTLDVNFRKSGLEFGGLATDEFLIRTTTGTCAAQAVDTTYSAITPTTVTGTGTGADIDITLLQNAGGTNYGWSNSTVSEILVNTPGNDYRPGDELLIPGNLLGGATPANDLTIVVAQAVDPGDAYPGKFISKLRSLTAQVVKQ